MINESCNMIRLEAQLAIANQKYGSQFLLTLDAKLQTEKLTYHLTLSRDHDGQRILQFDWMRGRSGCTNQKWYSHMLPSLDNCLHATN